MGWRTWTRWNSDGSLAGDSLLVWLSCHSFGYHSKRGLRLTAATASLTSPCEAAPVSSGQITIGWPGERPTHFLVLCPAAVVTNWVRASSGTRWAPPVSGSRSPAAKSPPRSLPRWSCIERPATGWSEPPGHRDRSLTVWMAVTPGRGSTCRRSVTGNSPLKLRYAERAQTVRGRPLGDSADRRQPDAVASGCPHPAVPDAVSCRFAAAARAARAARAS